METGVIKECPVAALAREAHILIEEFDRLDEQKFRVAGSAREVVDRRINTICARRFDLEGYAAHLLATSGIGAMYQMHLIRGLIEDIAELVSDEGGKYARYEEITRDIVRMLYSVRSYIEQSSGANADDACGDFYMPRAFDPHLLVEDAIAA